MPSQNIETAARLVIQINQGNQHQQGTHQGVQEKLEGCVNFVRPAPNTDDQVHGYQSGLKKHVKQHSVQSTENTNHQTGQDEKRAHVLIDTLSDDLPRRNDHNHSNECGKWDHPQGNTIYTKVIVNIEAVNPQDFFNMLHGSCIQRETCVQRQSEQERKYCPHQSNPPNSGGLIVPAQCQEQHTHKNWRPNRKAQQTHLIILLTWRAKRSMSRT